MSMQTARHAAHFKAHSSRHSQIDGAGGGDDPAAHSGRPLSPDSALASPGGRPEHGGAAARCRCSQSHGTRMCPRPLV